MPDESMTEMLMREATVPVVGAATSNNGRIREPFQHDNAHTRGLRADLAEARFAIQHAEERPPLEELGELPERAKPAQPAPAQHAPAPTLPSLSGGHTVTRCRLLGRTPDGLVVDCDDGRQLNVPPASIRQIAVGMVQLYDSGAGPAGPVVLADLALDVQVSGRALVLRFTHVDIALEKIAPAAANRQAGWTVLMVGLQAESGARRLPDDGGWPGPPLCGFRDEASFDASFYGGGSG